MSGAKSPWEQKFGMSTSRGTSLAAKYDADFKIAFDDLENRQNDLLMPFCEVLRLAIDTPIIDEKEWLREILNPIDFTADLEGHRERFIKESREWVFKEIEEWRCNRDGEPYQVLLAGPGFGKTAVVAKYLHDHEEKVLAYHLCFHNDVDKRDPDPYSLHASLSDRRSYPCVYDQAVRCCKGNWRVAQNTGNG